MMMLLRDPIRNRSASRAWRHRQRKPLDGCLEVLYLWFKATKQEEANHETNAHLPKGVGWLKGPLLQNN